MALPGTLRTTWTTEEKGVQTTTEPIKDDQGIGDHVYPTTSRRAMSERGGWIVIVIESEATIAVRGEGESKRHGTQQSCVAFTSLTTADASKEEQRDTERFGDASIVVSPRHLGN